MKIVLKVLQEVSHASQEVSWHRGPTGRPQPEIYFENLSSSPEGPLDQRIEIITTAIQARIASQFTVEKLARQANISASHLRHLFKLETGLTVSQYIKLIRMQQAEHLLRTTFLSVKEIMNRVGITNGSYFSREFKKAHGLPPSKYRRAESRRS